MYQTRERNMDRLAVAGMMATPARRPQGPAIWRDHSRRAPGLPVTSNGPIRSRRIVGNLAGLAGCDDLGLYTLPTGSCTNVAPENWASLNRPEIYEAATGSAPLPAGACPSGYAKNSWGQCEPQTALQQQNATSRFGQQLTTDRATQANLAEEARRLGAQYGLNVTCSIYQNSSPIPGDPVMYGTDCSVNGDPGHSAALMLLPGGMQNTVVEVSRAAGAPMMAPPPAVPGTVAPVGATQTAKAIAAQTASNQNATTAIAAAKTAAGTGGAASTDKPASTTGGAGSSTTGGGEKSATTGSSGGAGDGAGSLDLSSILSGSFDVAGYSIPYWAVGVAAAGLFFAKGGR